MSDKTPFPFDPFVDSLLGEKLLLVWKSLHHTEKDLLDSLRIHVLSQTFYFTPNASKQTLMVKYPNMIRDYLEKKEFGRIGEMLIGLARGNLSEIQSPHLDVAFELMEWMLTGFDIDKNLAEFLILFFGYPNIINVSFVERVRAEYIKELRG
jgi:hypothetical protein